MIILISFLWAALASPPLPSEFELAMIQDRTGQRVDIANLQFTGESGDRLSFGHFFGSKPVILIMAYYGCPHLCGLLLNGAADSLRVLEWEAGHEYQVVVVSINPSEKPDLAREKKKTLVKSMGRPESAKGWSLLTGDETNIKKLATSVGFGYRYDKQSGEYAHGAGIFVLTPDGRVSRTLYGFNFPERTLKLALLEASNGKIGTVMDRLMMVCFRYDPNSRGYGLFALRLVQAGGIATLMLIFSGYAFAYFRRKASQKGLGGG